MGDDLQNDHIAIVGVALRFPGANTLDEYWANLVGGVESISRLTEEELAAAGVEPRTYNHPRYVRAASLIDDMEGFDARFFGYTPREAETRDPQGRMFLEACYSAVQDSGYDIDAIDGLVGVFGGMANNMYGEHNVAGNRATREAIGQMAIEVGNSPDYLCTAVSYRLGLTGPSINVQTACSTALVAVHLAGQSLRTGECDYALAGAVEVELPYRTGYTWVEGSIYSRDGHVRPFDADASGTLFGTGVGVVALKRLADARADGDHIYAVIRGSAVNNDGGDRAGFTAPGVEGQARLVAEAMAVAQVHPDSIGFVEAHATGTLVGDPIEVAGLTRAYRSLGATGEQSTPIGSVKANIGHLGPAAGMAALIKVCLAMRERTIPPTINVSTPNPRLALDTSPFYVATAPTPWTQQPMRAGVSSFGIGGTNAHLVIEEPPPAPAAAPSTRRWQVLPVSAKTASAVEPSARRVADALDAGPLADIAYTLQVGRTAFPHRRAVVADTPESAASALCASAAPTKPAGADRVVFLFPGQGAQYPRMGEELYATEPVYRAAVDTCAELLRPHLGADIREIMRGDADRLRETRYTQPAVFVTGYATAALLGSAGIVPTAMLGHSVGELLAAHLAGVFDLKDALALVAIRGRLMQAMEPGVMLAVGGPAARVTALLPDGVEVAAFNSPRITVVAGPADDVERAQKLFEEDGLGCTPLHTSHAFHTASMSSAARAFVDAVAAVPRTPPAVPFASNVTGTWITGAEATDPEYWGRQLRSAVRFTEGIVTVSDERTVLVEVGPGDTLTKLARQAVGHQAVPVVATMRHALADAPDDAVFARALAAIWTCGATVDWAGYWADEQRRRVALPAYPFERRRFWVTPDKPEARHDDDTDEDGPRPVERAVFTSVWHEDPLPVGTPAVTGAHWLVLTSGHPVLDAVVARLRTGPGRVTVVGAGSGFAALDGDHYTVRPGSAEDLENLFTHLDGVPADIVHGFTLTAPNGDPLRDDVVAATTDAAFSSLLHLAQAVVRRSSSTRIRVLSSNLQDVSGDELFEPVKALLLGPTLVAERELSGVGCRSIDIALPSALPAERIADLLVADLLTPSPHQQVAWRGRRRWRLDYRTVPLEQSERPALEVRSGGVYLVTGGLGGIGLAVADEIATVPDTTIILVSRSAPSSEKAARLAALDARVETVRCDVSDPDALAELVGDIRRRHGRINGVFHSAGVAGGGMMAVRGDREAAAVLAPKVTGTLALHRLLGDEADFLVLFSSVTAVTGEFGQVDYCAANNVMDAYARWAGARGLPVISIGWGGWSEVGMAADLDTAAPQAFRSLQTGARSENSEHPLLGRRLVGNNEDVVFTTLLRPGGHWVHAEHRLAGRELMLGSALLEMVDAAYRETTGESAAEISELVFLGPIGVVQPTEVRLVMRPEGSGYAVTVSAANGSGTWSDRMTCRVGPLDTPPGPPVDLAEISARCPRPVPEEELREPDRMIEYGPHWHEVVRGVSVGDHEELSRIELDERFWVECGQYRLHPSLLDQAVNDAQYTPGIHERGESYLPLGYFRLRAFEPLPPKFWVHVRHLDDIDGDVTTADITLLHDDGQRIAEITGYSMRRVDPGAMRLALDSGGADEAHTGVAISEALGSIGISTAFGVEALRRIMHWCPAPHVVVTPEGLHRALRRTRALTVDVVERELGEARLALSDGGHERFLDTPYVAPETELEQMIVGLWSGALGVETIGIDDDFFELGGNSLVAVQLIARTRERLATELQIAHLFDHPTARRLAAFLATSGNAAA